MMTKKPIVLETEGLGPKPFHGRIALLVDRHTASAAEMIVAFARETNLVTVVETSRIMLQRVLSVGLLRSNSVPLQLLLPSLLPVAYHGPLAAAAKPATVSRLQTRSADPSGHLTSAVVSRPKLLNRSIRCPSSDILQKKCLVLKPR
jgi:Peptidase family S41